MDERIPVDPYDALLARWSAPVSEVDVDTSFGRTHLLLSGPAGGPPVVLLPGGGATATAWFAVAGLLAGRRVVCVDTLGDAGRSVPGGRRMRATEHLVAWLAETLSALELDTVDLAGHSYGGAVALRFALDRPDRVRRLALLDPTRCFTGMNPGYLLHAVAPLLRPSPARWRAFLDWETGGRGVDDGWSEVLVNQGRSGHLVVPARPRAAELRRLTVPVLVLAAELSRQHDVARLRAGARQLPDVRLRTLAGVSHHQVPTENPDELAAVLLEFLGER